MGPRKFEAIDGEEPKQNLEKIDWELQSVIRRYKGSTADKPQWCVYGVDRFGKFGVKHWIKPIQGDELAAFRIAKLETTLGGDMHAVMTEWNENLKTAPAYRHPKERSSGPFGPDSSIGI